MVSRRMKAGLCDLLDAGLVKTQLQAEQPLKRLELFSNLALDRLTDAVEILRRLSAIQFHALDCIERVRNLGEGQCLHFTRVHVQVKANASLGRIARVAVPNIITLIKCRL